MKTPIRTLFFGALLLVGCNAKNDYPKAENAFDAAREFINACAQGDFSRAAYYMAPGVVNEAKLKETEAIYRQKDKEGRQQLRTASINISEIKELNDSTTLVYYSQPPSKEKQLLQVAKQKGNWLVSYTAAMPRP